MLCFMQWIMYSKLCRIRSVPHCCKFGSVVHACNLPSVANICLTLGIINVKCFVTVSVLPGRTPDELVLTLYRWLDRMAVAMNLNHAIVMIIVYQVVFITYNSQE